MHLETFKIKPGAEADWAKCVEANSGDAYSAGVLRYCAHWANLMEQRLNESPSLKVADIAQKASADADTEGITGFMYGYAVSVLSQCWLHGEELRRWHNLDTQIGNEGERANETGAVLNPALLSLG